MLYNIYPYGIYFYYFDNICTFVYEVNSWLKKHYRVQDENVLTLLVFVQELRQLVDDKFLNLDVESVDPALLYHKVYMIMTYCGLKFI